MALAVALAVARIHLDMMEQAILYLLLVLQRFEHGVVVAVVAKVALVNHLEG